MLRVDRGFAQYLRLRAKKEGLTVCALTRQMHLSVLKRTTGTLADRKVKL